MDLQLLQTLKEKLVKAKNFGTVLEYFFDHFGDDAEFIKLGERANDPFLEMVIGQVANQLFGKPVPMTRAAMTRIPEHFFVHGACFLGSQMANIFYFEDIKVGLMAVTWSSKTDETKVIRFSGRLMAAPPGMNPSVN